MEILKKVGNIVATIILGDVKDKITETRKDVEYIRKELDEDIKPTLKDVEKKVVVLWEERLATQHSPMKLNKKGEDVLEKSGIKKFVDDNFSEFFNNIKEKNPANAYQVQEIAKQVVFDVKKDQAMIQKLQVGAYNTGVDVDSVLLVGSLYLRDLVLSKFNFKLEDVDKK